MFKNKFKKLIAYIIISLIIFLIYQKNNYKNIIYVSLGDGYSLGVNSYNYENYGYSDYFRDYLNKKNKLKFYTKNYSSKNKLIKELQYDILINKKMNINNKKIKIKEILRESKYITLTVGIDDLIYKNSLLTTPTDEKLKNISKTTYKEFNELIKLINKYYRHRVIVIGYNTNNIKNNNLKYIIKKYNNYLRKNNKIIYIDTTNLLKNSNKYYSKYNSIYPNNIGYKKISTKIVEKIK